MPGHRKRRQFKQTRRFYEGHGDRTEKGRNVGATRVTSARVDRRILRQAVAAPQATCTAILQHVQDTLDHSISTRTISRRLVANGLHSCRPLRRLPLTPPNRRQHESRFCLSSDSRRVRVWRRRGERSNPAAIVERPTVRQRGIMVWGAIAYDSRSPLLRIRGTMTAQRYVDDVLRPVTLPYLQGVPNALYQQDNARPHTARISQQALQDVQMLPWPPYSSDLSPIEHVWDIIGRRLPALPQPRSEDELWQMVEREWRAIPQDAIRTLIDSLPRRVAACIAHSLLSILPSLVKLFNECLVLGYYPESWKHSVLKIITKPQKADYEAINSYRPISLTSNFSKIFETIIKNKILNYYNHNNLLSHRQHGFTKRKSTITALDKITETILKHKQNELVALIAIDISGAFDNAWWPALIKRMDEDHVPAVLIKIIQSFLNRRRKTSLTFSNTTISKYLSKGCPQGGPLSPLLWNIVLNDLLINFASPNSEIICYADDVSIVCWHKTIEGLKYETERTLNYVIQWCTRNKLKLSPEKTGLIHMHGKQNIPMGTPNFIIKPVEEVKILGIKFSNHRIKSKINFTPHINDILCKINRMKNLLFSLCGKMWGLDAKKRLILYKTLFRPILTYGSEIWYKFINKRSKQRLNSQQYQILLWVVRAYKTTSSNCIHSLAKIPILTDQIESLIIKYDLANLSKEEINVFRPHAPTIIHNYIESRMAETIANTNETFRKFFPFGIPFIFVRIFITHSSSRVMVILENFCRKSGQRMILAVSVEKKTKTQCIY
ncbi:hypothetical protein LAZ67_X003594 [Cordylochernes scorpioides]|uniref:Reverse transcriptase domain-containing protein n=1 Tax=Cordylochernes scorpioides TaxID=51811 RepID=A0ABY6LUJ0_9ARAC|nr:hypothetical protein LAZ67_X003594 [Cordylochernes scorpioides]